MASGMPVSGASHPDAQACASPYPPAAGGSSMYRWLTRRLLISIPVLLGITVLSFIFVRLAPGDPVRMMINPEYLAGGAEEYIALRRAELGLDRPVPIQYVAWLGEVARGNLGYSFFDRR